MGQRKLEHTPAHRALLSEVELLLHRQGTWKPSEAWLAVLGAAMGGEGVIGSPRTVYGTPEALLRAWATERGLTWGEGGELVLPGWQPQPVRWVAVQRGLFEEGAGASCGRNAVEDP